MNLPSAEQAPGEWQPQIEQPRVAVYGWWDLHDGGRQAGATVDDYLMDFGYELSEDLQAKAVQIEFPASHRTTIVDDAERSSSFLMRYTQQIFQRCESPAMAALEAIYRQELPEVINIELGIRAEALANAERNGEAYIINGETGESLDVHRDELFTVAAYPSPGSALVVSHCVNARTPEDIRNSPVTLVLPGAGSFVIFDGVKHPHYGITTGINPEDPVEVKGFKLSTLGAGLNIARIKSDVFGYEQMADDRSYRELSADPGLNGDRLVVSLNLGVAALKRQASITGVLAKALEAADTNHSS